MTKKSDRSSQCVHRYEVGEWCDVCDGPKPGLERRAVVRVRMVHVEYEGETDAGVAMLVGLLNGLLEDRKGSPRS